jgi:hypothetical protein
MKTNEGFCLLIVTVITAFTLVADSAFAQAGLPLWTNRYIGPVINANESAQALCVDSSGNAIVTGWVDPGSQNYNYVTIKYSSGGVPLWTNYYNGPANSFDFAVAVAVDVDGNAIVTGNSRVDTVNFFDDYITIKYSSAGVPLWTNRYDGPLHADERPTSLVVDTNGNVYVTGTSDGTTFREFATIKYSSAGVPLWTKRYNPGCRFDQPIPCAMAVDSSGKVYVAGDNYVSGVGYRVHTIAYSTTGVPLWTNTSSASIARFGGMALDPAGGIYLVGDTYPTAPWDYLIVKYSNAGLPLWTNYYDGPSHGDDEYVKLAMDPAGNPIVTGSSESNTNSPYNYNYATIKYSSTGVPLWTNRYDGGAGDDRPVRIATDSRGNVYVTGTSTGTNGLTVWATVAYSSAGVPLWTNRHAGSGTYSAAPTALAVDAGGGNVYVTGRASYLDSGWDMVTIKYVGVPPAAPSILSPPLSRTNITGTTAGFSVTASGDEPLKYQWRKGGANLLNDGKVSGVTMTNLVIANVQPSDAGDYSVVVTNSGGSATSSVAQLTVYSPGRFSDVAYWPAMGFIFVFRDGTVGRPYCIQTSTSLAEDSWIDWMSFNYTEPVGFMDLGAPERERRFYRAVTP